MKDLPMQGFRFLLGGGANTLATYGLYCLLLLLLSPQGAYAVSFAAGVILSYVLNLRFVFQAHHSFKKMALFPLIYLVVFVIGSTVLQVAIRYFSVRASLAPLLSIACTLPVSFLLTKWLLGTRSNKATDPT